MKLQNGQLGCGKSVQERISALLVAAAATLLVFAAIHTGFAPQGAGLAGTVAGESSLAL